MRRLGILCAAASLAAAACGGQSAEECVSELESAAPAPTIDAPAPGRLDIDPESLAVAASAAPEGFHLETEAEIWRLAGGEPVLRVWRARLERPDPETAPPTSFGLADGELEGLSQETGLIPWEDYSVRVRYRVLAAEASCSEWTAWSEHRRFRIDDGSTYLFDDSQILDIALEIPPDSFEAIDAEARPPGCVPYSRSYYPGNAIVDGTRFDGAGLRVKGGCGSARNLDEKAAFKVNLSFDDPAVPGCPESRRIHGRKRLTLNNMVQDRSFTHERVGYHFYKLLGVPTPRVAHVRLEVNGEPWGLYLNVESIDRRMLSRWFESNDGMLYEGTYFCDLLPENVPPDGNCIQGKFDYDECSSPDPGEDPRDYSVIREMTAEIAAIEDGEFYPAITEIMEWDAFLSLWAADSIMAHWDGYEFDIINNYRVYHHPITDKWTIVPTGIDQTFTRQREVDPFSPQAILATRCLAEPDCEETFVERLREALAVFESAGLEQMVADIDAQIAAEVEADPRKPGSVADYENGQAAMLDFIAERPAEIRAYIQARGFEP